MTNPSPFFLLYLQLNIIIIYQLPEQKHVSFVLDNVKPCNGRAEGSFV